VDTSYIITVGAIGLEMTTTSLMICAIY
jgi:hypothetical protein